MARSETVVNGNVVATEHLTSSAEGVFRCRYNGIEVSPPLCIFKYPIKENATWEAASSSRRVSRTLLYRTKHPHGMVSLNQVDAVANCPLVVFNSFMRS